MTCPRRRADTRAGETAGGSVIIENIVNLPGIGRLLLDAFLDRDYPIVSGVNLVFAAGAVVIDLVVDLLYEFLDPCVRYR